MKPVPNMLDAVIFAVTAHEGQMRKFNGGTYILHPLKVADLLQKAGMPLHVRIAAVLHDTVEDCGVSLSDITVRFGEEVSKLVAEVTDEPRSTGNSNKRRELNRQRLAQASMYGKTLKCADIICNVSDTAAADKAFARFYLQDKRELMPELKGADAYFYALACSTIFKAIKHWEQKYDETITTIRAA